MEKQHQQSAGQNGQGDETNENQGQSAEEPYDEKPATKIHDDRIRSFNSGLGRS